MRRMKKSITREKERRGSHDTQPTDVFIQNNSNRGQRLKERKKETQEIMFKIGLIVIDVLFAAPPPPPLPPALLLVTASTPTANFVSFSSDLCLNLLK